MILGQKVGNIRLISSEDLFFLEDFRNLGPKFVFVLASQTAFCPIRKVLIENWMTSIGIRIAWPASEITARHCYAINTVELKILCFYAYFKTLSLISRITIFYVCMRHCEQGYGKTFMKTQGVQAQRKVKNHCLADEFVDV